MSRAVRCLAVLLALAFAAPASAARLPAKLNSLRSSIDWINDYRRTNDVAHAPFAIRALSYYGAFKDPETSGAYVGFIAGLLASNPDKAEQLIGKMLPVREEDQWAIVRGIAYSGLPNWKTLLRQFANRLDKRELMIADYLNGRLPTLGSLLVKPSPSTWDIVQEKFKIKWPGKRRWTSRMYLNQARK